MMITEQEAKKRVCPLMRYCVNSRDASLNEAGAVYEQSTCQASDCMAWRWKNGTPEFREVAEQPRGYCGMAGKP